MVFQSLRAAEELAKHGVSVAVWDMHTIKPIDKDAIKNAASKTSLIVSVEEHNMLGGLGSAIAECLSSYENSPRLLTLGIQDCFLKPGNYEFMLQQSGLTPDSIKTQILSALNSNTRQ